MQKYEKKKTWNSTTIIQCRMNEDFNATYTQKVKVATEAQQKIKSNCPVKLPNCVVWYDIYLILCDWGDTAFVLKHWPKIYELKYQAVFS